MLNQTLERINRERLIAVIRMDSAESAMEAARAVREGGVSILEITLTVPDAPELIQQLAKEGDLVVGAGTVLTTREASEVIAMGAKFIASPVTNPQLVAVCRDADVVSILGGATPSEIYNATRAGANLVKVFPVDALGGPPYIEELLKPLPFLKLVPYGVRSIDTYRAYQRLGVEAVAVGSLLTHNDAGPMDAAGIREEAKHLLAIRDEVKT